MFGIPARRYCSSWCKFLYRKFGLTIQDYNQKLEQQNGKCAICETESPGGKTKRWTIDHYHVDGFMEMTPEEKRKYFRGLLCINCNTGIGMLQDSEELVTKALNYLSGFKKHP